MANIKSKRLFIALPIPLEIKEIINQYYNKLNLNNNYIKKVDSHNLHITLYFIGEVSKEKETDIKIALNHLSNMLGTLKFSLGNIAAFPTLSRPRVLILTCLDKKMKSFKLQKAIKSIMLKQGFNSEYKKWHPHITIGRVKKAINLEYIKEIDPLKLDFQVNHFELMSSQLRPEGAKYFCEGSYKL